MWHHNFDGAFRSNYWVFHSSVSIKVELYEVLLSCTSLIICCGMDDLVSIPSWCMMENLVSTSCKMYVFIMDCHVCFEIPLLQWWRDTHCHYVLDYVMLIEGLLWVIVPVEEHLVEGLCHSCRGHISLYDRIHNACTSSPFPALNEAANTILTPGLET